MKQKYFIGVDISKKKVDVACIDSSFKAHLEKEVANSEEKLVKFFETIVKKLSCNRDEVLICCEETGIYSRPLEKACIQMKMSLWVESAIKIKRASSSLRGKSDSMDALRIADYACRYSDKQRLYSEPSNENKELQIYLNARETIIDEITRMQVQLKETKTHDQQKYRILKTCFTKPISCLKRQLQEIEIKIDALVKGNTEMKANAELITSIPGIGKQNALQFMVYTRNFTAFANAKHLACYTGVAPFPNESGTVIKRARVSAFANKKLKKLLHLAAMAAIKSKGELKEYYIRKVSEGKNKMLVLNNIRNKLIARMFAILKRKEPYVSFNYEKKTCL